MPKRIKNSAAVAVPKAPLWTRIKKDVARNYLLYLLMVPGFLIPVSYTHLRAHET